MVIVRLLGGLGNQFFQYAVGRAVASRHKVPLKLDISFFDRYPGREYRLQHFNIAAVVASPEEVERLAGKRTNSLSRRMNAIWQKRLPYYRRSVFEQQGHNYDANIRYAPDHVYLAGYWQSEKFFEPIASNIRHELTVKEPIDVANSVVRQQIEQTESVSLHVRRGDYVSDPITHQHHGLCSLDYYGTAVDKLTRTVKHPHFFVFSDDMAWVRQNLALDHDITYVDYNGVGKDYEDMRLMRYCKHHIIANSSFSWWGAWLCDYRQKIVIAPERWYSVCRDARDLIPDSWLRL